MQRTWGQILGELEADRRPVGQGHESKEGRGTRGGWRGRQRPDLKGPHEDLTFKPKCSRQGSDVIRFMFYKDCTGVCVENGVGTRGPVGRKVGSLIQSPRGEILLAWLW